MDFNRSENALQSAAIDSGVCFASLALAKFEKLIRAVS